jgi:hypothetical protein
MFSCLSGSRQTADGDTNKTHESINNVRMKIKELNLQTLHYDTLIEDQEALIRNANMDFDAERKQYEEEVLGSLKETRTVLLELLSKTRLIYEELQKAINMTEVAQVLQQESVALGSVMSNSLQPEKIDRLMASLEIQLDKSKQAKRILLQRHKNGGDKATAAAAKEEEFLDLPSVPLSSTSVATEVVEVTIPKNALEDPLLLY